MVNANIELSGYVGNVVESMIRLGYAKTKTEAIRLALFQFDQTHRLTDDEVYHNLTGKILGEVAAGKMKTRKFSASELG